MAIKPDRKIVVLDRQGEEILKYMKKLDMLEVWKMSKIEECYVIQRDDGRYCETVNGIFTSNLCCALLCNDMHLADYFILEFNLQNCKPVKIEIKVVGE